MIGFPRLSRNAVVAILLAVPLLAPYRLSGQETGSEGATPTQQRPPIIVTAQKQAQDAQDVPASMSVLTGDALEQAGVQWIHDAAGYVPNLTLQEFTARKLSFPFVRGIGSGPLNPSVTTYIDDVPQLNANSSSIELLDIGQIEFLRGTQGSLYGRNTLGGLIHIQTRRPDETRTLRTSGSWGNYARQDYRVLLSGPLTPDESYFSVAGGYSRRDGFTKNFVTGNDLDDREATFARAQILLTPDDEWEARLILFGERARDGDFALGDLASVRSSPHRVAHDFEGFTERDIFGPTLILSHFGESVEFKSISGFVWWKTFDATDLDTTPSDLVVRRNDENLWQFTQEFRLATPQDAPVILNDRVDLRWLLGTFLFSSDYDQDASNALSMAAAAGLGVPFAFNDQSQADLDNMGLAVFGQATFTLDEKLDVILGARLDYEHKEATLDTFTTPATAPPVHEQFSEHFTEVSPKAGLAYHLTDDAMVYASWSQGFKAGGFNATAPPGEAEIGEETSATYEAGVKAEGWDDRVTVNAALFYVDWEDLQLDVPNPMVPGRFFVDNVGKARSSGFEVETNVQMCPGWDLFGGVGYLDTRFHSGSTTLGMPVGGNDLPFAPETTWHVGTQFQQDLECCGLTLYGRAEVTGYSGYFYEATNAASQDAFNLANFRLGVRKGNWNAEAWVRNAFDTDYVPLAFPFDPMLTPSGFVGEAGAPVTYGVTVGIRF